MLDKDYPILLKFHTRSKIRMMLDVKYLNGFYFEQYVILAENPGGYFHELYTTVMERIAHEKFERYCNDVFWSK